MKMLRITLEGKTYEVGVEVLDNYDSTLPQQTHFPTAPTPAITVPTASDHVPVTPSITSAEGCFVVISPMAGHVFKCLVKPGDVVEFNQELLVLDAMKMETPVVAPLSGTVRAVLVKEGDAVDDGHALLHIEGLPK